MRFYKYLVRPPDGALHPSEADLMPELDAAREAIVAIRRLDAERGTVLYRLRGDAEGMDAALEAHDDILAHEVIDGDGDALHLYTQFELDGLTETMLDLADEHGILLETPFPYREDGALEVRLAGLEEEMRDSVEAFLDDPRDDIDMSLEEVSSFVPEEERIAASLTERQRDVVEAAVERGYYATPREVTHRKLADVTGCSPSTAGEHLQKAENKIVPRALR